jgi:hypothetical protein
MQLHCPACHKPIPAQDVNIDLGLARCLACNEVFGLLDKIEGLAGPRPVANMPPRFRVDRWGPELVITRRWYTHAVWALLAFCIFWDGFLVVWYSAGIHILLHGSEGSAMTWVMLLFPVLHVAVGLGLTYGVLCTFINSTVIRAATGELSVSHGPLPSVGNCRIPIADVQQLFCTEKRHRGDDSWHCTYNVLVLKRDDTQVTLVSGLEHLDQAWFIEQQVEEHLKIRDERVAGEATIPRGACRGKQTAMMA